MRGWGIFSAKKDVLKFQKGLDKITIFGGEAFDTNYFFEEALPMKHRARKARDGLRAIIQTVAKNAVEFVQNPKRDFTRNRKLGIEALLSMLLCMEGKSLSCELLNYFGCSPGIISTPGFVQQRAKLLPKALEYIFRKFSDAFHGDRLYRGFRLLATDGSDVQIPTDPTDKESYFPETTQRTHYNITKIMALYDLQNRCYVDAIVKGKAVANENKLLVEMVKRSDLKDPVILVADRNFECWDTLAQLQSKGWFYVIRVKEYKGFISGLNVPDEEEFDLSVKLSLTRSQSKVVKELCKDRNRYRYIPTCVRCDPLDQSGEVFYTLSFRLVRIKLPNGNIEVLVTNIDTARFPPKELKKLYAMRWGIETSFRELKFTIGLLHFHCKKAAFIQQEIYSRLIMYNFTEFITARVVQKKSGNKYDCRVRFPEAALICRQLLRDRVDPERAEAAIARYVSPVRPGRNAPRNLNEKKPVSFIYRVA